MRVTNQRKIAVARAICQQWGAGVAVIVTINPEVIQAVAYGKSPGLDLAAKALSQIILQAITELDSRPERN